MCIVVAKVGDLVQCATMSFKTLVVVAIWKGTDRIAVSAVKVTYAAVCRIIQPSVEKKRQNSLVVRVYFIVLY